MTQVRYTSVKDGDEMYKANIESDRVSSRAFRANTPRHVVFGMAAGMFPRLRDYWCCLYFSKHARKYSVGCLSVSKLFFTLKVKL